MAHFNFLSDLQGGDSTSSYLDSSRRMDIDEKPSDNQSQGVHQVADRSFLDWVNAQERERHHQNDEGDSQGFPLEAERVSLLPFNGMNESHIPPFDPHLLVRPFSLPRCLPLDKLVEKLSEHELTDFLSWRERDTIEEESSMEELAKFCIPNDQVPKSAAAHLWKAVNEKTPAAKALFDAIVLAAKTHLSADAFLVATLEAPVGRRAKIVKVVVDGGGFRFFLEALRTELMGSDLLEPKYIHAATLLFRSVCQSGNADQLLHVLEDPSHWEVLIVVQVFSETGHVPPNNSALARRIDTLLSSNKAIGEYQRDPWSFVDHHFPDYKKIEAFYRARSQVEEYADYPMTSTLIAHVGGEKFIKGTSLQGHSTTKSANFFQLALAQWLHAQGEGEFEGKSQGYQLLHELEGYEKYSRLILAIKQNNLFQKSNEIAATIAQDLKTAPGHTLLFPIGFRDDSGAHAMICRIQLSKKQKKDDAYSISIYQTGDGAQFHPKRIIDNQSYLYPVFKITGLTASKGFHLETAIMAMLVVKQKQFPRRRERFTAADLYELIAQIAPGKREFPKAIPDSDYFPIQLSGVCSFKVLRALAFVHLPRQTFHRFDSFMRLMAIDLYAAPLLYDGRFSSTEEMPRSDCAKLLSMVVVQQAREIEEKRDELPLGVYRQTSEYVATVRDLLSVSQEPTRSQTAYVGVTTFSTLFSRGHSISGEVRMQGFWNEGILKPPRLLMANSIKDFKNASLREYLEEAQCYLQRLEEAGETTLLLPTIRSIMRQLPTTVKTKKSQEEYEAIIGHLHTLATKYIALFAKSEEKPTLTDILCRSRLLLLADAVMHRWGRKLNGGEDLFKDISLCPAFVNALSWLHCPSAVCDSRDYQRLVKTWKKSVLGRTWLMGGDCLFALERMMWGGEERAWGSVLKDRDPKRRILEKLRDRGIISAQTNLEDETHKLFGDKVPISGSMRTLLLFRDLFWSVYEGIANCHQMTWTGPYEHSSVKKIFIPQRGNGTYVTESFNRALTAALKGSSSLPPEIAEWLVDEASRSLPKDLPSMPSKLLREIKEIGKCRDLRVRETIDSAWENRTYFRSLKGLQILRWLLQSQRSASSTITHLSAAYRDTLQHDWIDQQLPRLFDDLGRWALAEPDKRALMEYLQLLFAYERMTSKQNAGEACFSTAQLGDLLLDPTTSREWRGFLGSYWLWRTKRLGDHRERKRDFPVLVALMLQAPRFPSLYRSSQQLWEAVKADPAAYLPSQDEVDDYMTTIAHVVSLPFNVESQVEVTLESTQIGRFKIDHASGFITVNQKRMASSAFNVDAIPAADILGRPTLVWTDAMELVSKDTRIKVYPGRGHEPTHTVVDASILCERYGELVGRIPNGDWTYVPIDDDASDPLKAANLPEILLSPLFDRWHLSGQRNGDHYLLVGPQVNKALLVNRERDGSYIVRDLHSGFHLANLTDQPLEELNPFCYIERPSGILIWVDDRNHQQAVDLLRLGLRFEAQMDEKSGDLLWYSTTHEGYFLPLEEVAAPIRGAPDYLLLHNNVGCRLLLHPSHLPCNIREKERPLNWSVGRTYPSDYTQVAKVWEYSAPPIEEEGDPYRGFKALGEEGTILRLVMINYMAGNLDVAKDYLEARAVEQGFTDLELNMLANIAEGPLSGTIRDQTASSYALACLAAAHLVIDALNKKEYPLKRLSDSFKTVYEAYMQRHRDVRASLRLNIDQERALYFAYLRGKKQGVAGTNTFWGILENHIRYLSGQPVLTRTEEPVYVGPEMKWGSDFFLPKIERLNTLPSLGRSLRPTFDMKLNTDAYLYALVYRALEVRQNNPQLTTEMRMRAIWLQRSILLHGSPHHGHMNAAFIAWLLQVKNLPGSTADIRQLISRERQYKKPDKCLTSFANWVSSRSSATRKAHKAVGGSACVTIDQLNYALTATLPSDTEIKVKRVAERIALCAYRPPSPVQYVERRHQTGTAHALQDETDEPGAAPAKRRKRLDETAVSGSSAQAVEGKRRSEEIVGLAPASKRARIEGARNTGKADVLPSLWADVAGRCYKPQQGPSSRPKPFPLERALKQVTAPEASTKLFQQLIRRLRVAYSTLKCETPWLRVIDPPAMKFLLQQMHRTLDTKYQQGIGEMERFVHNTDTELATRLTVHNRSIGRLEAPLFSDDLGRWLADPNKPTSEEPCRKTVRTAIRAYLEKLLCEEAISRLRELEILGDEGDAAAKAAAERNLRVAVRKKLVDPKTGGSELSDLLLYYQMTTETILRQGQVDFIDSVNSELFASAPDSKKALVVQLDCGAGKTKVLTPLLVLLHAMKKKLACMVVPESNYVVNRSDLLRTMALFGRNVIEFRMARSDGNDQDGIALLVQRLEEARRNGDVVITTPRQLHAFSLGYGESIWSDPTRPAAEKLHELRLFFRKHVGLILDEGEVALNPDQQMIFALRANNALEPHQWEIPTLIFDHGYNRFLESDHTRATYFQDTLPKVVEALLEDERMQSIVGIQDKELIKRYLLHDRRSQMTPTDLVALEGTVNDEAAWKKLQQIRAELQVYFLYTAQSILNVDFGRAKVEEAVPYQGNNSPTENETFQHIPSRIYYTFRMLIEEGATKQQVLKVLRRWQQKLERGDEPPAEGLEGLREASLNDPDEQETWVANFKENPTLCREVLLCDLFPKLTVHQGQLAEGPQRFDGLGNCLVAFTATPTNVDSYPLEMTRSLNDQINATVLQNLQDPHLCNVGVSDNFAQILGDNPHIRFILDPGAIYAGISNKQIASQLLPLARPRWQFVLFYNKANQIEALDREGTTSPFSSSKHTPSNSLVFFDQNHCTGADFPQNGEEHSLMILNKWVTFDNAAQAIRRLRQWGLPGSQQKAHICVPPDLAKTIWSQGQTSCDIPSLVIWLLCNQARTVVPSLETTLEDQVRHVYRKRAEALSLSGELTDEKRKTYAPLFVETFNQDQINATLAQLTPPTAPNKRLTQYAQQLEGRYRDLLENSDREELSRIFQHANVVLGGNQLEDDPAAQVGLNTRVQGLLSLLQEREEIDGSAAILHRAFKRQPFPTDLFKKQQFCTFFKGGEEGRPYDINGLVLSSLQDLIGQCQDVDPRIFFTANVIKVNPPKLPKGQKPRGVLSRDYSQQTKWLLCANTQFKYLLAVSKKESAKRYKERFIILDRKDAETVLRALKTSFSVGKKYAALLCDYRGRILATKAKETPLAEDLARSVASIAQQALLWSGRSIMRPTDAQTEQIYNSIQRLRLNFPLDCAIPNP